MLQTVAFLCREGLAVPPDKHNWRTCGFPSVCSSGRGARRQLGWLEGADAGPKEEGADVPEEDKESTSVGEFVLKERGPGT